MFKDALPNIEVTRTIDSDVFYKPFQIICGDHDEMGVIIASFGLNETTGQVFAFDMVYTITPFNAYAYEAVSGRTYENEYQKNGYSYMETAEIDFCDDRFDVETFDLPYLN